MARSHRVPPGPRVEASAERVAGGRPGAGAAEPGHTPQAVPGRSPGEVVADSPVAEGAHIPAAEQGLPPAPRAAVGLDPRREAAEAEPDPMPEVAEPAGSKRAVPPAGMAGVAAVRSVRAEAEAGSPGGRAAAGAAVRPRDGAPAQRRHSEDSTGPGWGRSRRAGPWRHRWRRRRPAARPRRRRPDRPQAGRLRAPPPTLVPPGSSPARRSVDQPASGPSHRPCRTSIPDRSRRRTLDTASSNPSGGWWARS